MDDPFSIMLKILLLLVLILINAFFTSSEIAIITLNDNKIRKMAEEGDKRAKKVLKLTSDTANFFSTIQIGITLAGFLTAAAASFTFSDMLAAAITNSFNVTSTAGKATVEGVSVAIITIVISFFSLVLGELLPKRIAMQRAQKVAFSTVGTLLIIDTVFKPIIKFLTLSTNVCVRLFGLDPHANENVVTEEEIMMLVDAGEEKGVIEESQREMINNIFEFDDISATDVMRHRTEIVAVEASEMLTDVIKEVIEEGYSRIPVYEEDLDNIVGILYVKDFLPFVGKTLEKQAQAKDIMRHAHHVPESIRCGDLFKEMIAKHTHMVIAVDEYGGTAGLVTLEDLVETIVGNIQDEYDDEKEEIEKIDDGSFSIDGTTNIDEVEDILGVRLPEGEYDTLGGMIMSMLGRIPAEGEAPEVLYGGFIFKVEGIEERRIQRIVVKKMEVSETEVKELKKDNKAE
jgi:putative hemolysin